MAILAVETQLKLRDDDPKSLGYAPIEASPVVCPEGLVEGADFAVDRALGTVRRLREMGESEQGLFTFRFEWSNARESEAEVAAEAAQQAMVDLVAQAAQGIAWCDQAIAQGAAMTQVQARDNVINLARILRLVIKHLAPQS